MGWERKWMLLRKQLSIKTTKPIMSHRDYIAIANVNLRIFCPLGTITFSIETHREVNNLCFNKVIQ